jgi:hypothetical protein
VEALEFEKIQPLTAVMTVAHAAAAQRLKLAVGVIMTFILALSVVVDSRCDEFQVICIGLCWTSTRTVSSVGSHMCRGPAHLTWIETAPC